MKEKPRKQSENRKVGEVGCDTDNSGKIDRKIDGKESEKNR